MEDWHMDAEQKGDSALHFWDFYGSESEKDDVPTDEAKAIGKRRREFSIAMHDFIYCKDVDKFYQSFSGYIFNHAVDWHNQKHILELISEASQVYMMLDKNIMSYIKAMPAGTSNDINRDRSLAGMLWFFAFGCNAKFDCSTASDEYYMTSRQNNDPFNLMIERQALEMIISTVWENPMHLLDFSLGTIDKLQPSVLLDCAPYITDEKLPEKYDAFYITSLKIFLLQKEQSLSDLQKFTAFMDWQLNEFLISGAAVVYASMLFARKVRQHPKYKNATSYEEAINYCKGVAWDLFYTRDYSEHTNHPEQIWFFASGDRTLLQVFNALFSDNVQSSEINEKLQTLFKSHWDSRGAIVYNHYVAMKEEVERQGNSRGLSSDMASAQRENLEGQIKLLMEGYQE
jgi:hypothetical protein